MLKPMTDGDLVNRLLIIKRMIASSKDMMPNTREEYRRETMEEIDELIDGLRNRGNTP